MKEIWKDVIGYEGLYKVSNLGRIKSLPKKIGFREGYYSPEKILKLSKTKDGYLKVTLTKDKKEKTVRVHRIVLSAFNYIKNMDEMMVNHKDENKTNNNVENLEWCTAKYNSNYGTSTKRSSEKKFKKIKCVTTGKEFNSLKEAAKFYNIKGSSHICQCAKGQRKSAGKYKGINLKWEYI